MEDLVRASLKINPELRGEKSTREVMQSLQTGAPKAAPGPKSAPENSARQSNLAFFFDNKTRQLAEARADLQRRRAAIDTEELGMKDRMCREIVDFLRLAAETPNEAKTVLERYPQLIKDLGVRADVLLRDLAAKS